MQVFKAFYKSLRRQITSVLLYVIAFEFDGHIPATPKDPEDQEYLRDYWDSVTRM